jgi:hypothetical protein
MTRGPTGMGAHDGPERPQVPGDRGGLSPSGAYVLETAVSLRRCQHYFHLGAVTARNTPILVLLLALLGLIRVGKDRIWKQPGHAPAAGALSAISDLDSLRRARRISRSRTLCDREAHVLICAALLLAGFGLVRLTGFRAALCAAGFCLGVYGGNRFLARQTLAPNMQLSYSLARYLDGVLQERSGQSFWRSQFRRGRFRIISIKCTYQVAAQGWRAPAACYSAWTLLPRGTSAPRSTLASETKDC